MNSNDYGTSASTTNKTSRSEKLDQEAKEGKDDFDHGVDLKKYLEAGKTVGRTLESQITTRPYVALGIVGGAGFFIGSLFGSRFGQLMVAIGIGYAATKMLEGQDIDVKKMAKKVEKAANA